MPSEDLTELLTSLWMYAAGPLVGFAALLLTVRLKLPQILHLPAAFRALHEDDPGAPGSAHPAAAVAMSTVTSYGAAAAVGAATAVSLGGPGAIAWVWLFSFFLAPLRMGEAVLARTAPPGQAGSPTGSLAGRLLGDGSPLIKGLGWALLVLVPLAGFVFFGGTHGGAVIEASEQLLPGSALTLGVLVAVAGAALAMIPRKRASSILGWIAAVSLIALFGAALMALFSDPLRGIGGIGRAIDDAIYDMPSAGAFSGALAGEIAIAAMLHLLPPLAAAGGVDGAWQAEAQAQTTRAQASAALLGALAYGVLTTVLGLSFVATNAFTRPVESSRAVGDLRYYGARFETVSQRLETSRLEDALIRVIDGETGVVEVNPATERGMVRDFVFEDRGEPADALLRVADGEIVEIQQPGEHGALEVAPPSAYQDILVRGQMLPSGGRLLAESMTSGGGSVASRVALAALLLLAMLGVAGWGFGVRRTLDAVLPAVPARLGALLPALGLGLAATGVVQDFSSWGLLVAALLTIVSSAALILRSGQIRVLLAGRGASATKLAATTKPTGEGAPAPTKRKKKKRKK